MITLFVSFIILIIAYFTYSKFVDNVFGANANNRTPAVKNADGVDYVPLNSKKAYLIQFLNIAGLGPIYGAILGALYGPAAFFWIIFGAIFAGGVHDYFSGMISMRHDGKSMPELAGRYLGKSSRVLMLLFSASLLLFVSVVFIVGPAGLLANLKLAKDSTPVFEGTLFANIETWVFIILGYYLLATMLPIDKIIGRFYPIFGAVLIFMAISIGFMMIKNSNIPEITSLRDFIHPAGTPLWPILFFTISCGALSGFHSTQSPLMARCLVNEKQGKFVFYGAMLTESALAMVWAAASMSYFGSQQTLYSLIQQGGAGLVVNEISLGYLGTIGGIIAILGVIICPITSGDTSLRSLRITIADFMSFDQKSILKRLLISVPIFIIAYSISKLGFEVIWRYFTFSNQALAMFSLWTASAYLVYHKKNHWIATLPAMFITFACSTYIFIAKEFYIGFNYNMANIFGLLLGVVVCGGFFTVIYYYNKKAKLNNI